MENASKALLIAGAILIVILIIGVGMIVFNSIGGTIDEGVRQMSSQEKTMFNQQFEQYAGDRINGSNVKALINKVNANNSQLGSNTDPKYMKFKSGCSYTTTSAVSSAQTYTVTVTDTNKDGLDDEINITLFTTP